MAVTAIAGATFTVTVDSTDYSAQVTSGSLSRSANVVKTKTLGPNTISTQTDRDDTVDCSFLYDADGGFYDALFTASDTLTPVSIKIVGGSGTWTGTMSVASLSADFNAEDVSNCSATFEGYVSFATTV